MKTIHSHTLDLVIQGKSFTTAEQFLTGLQIKQLAGISVDDPLYLSIQEPWQDELIDNVTSVNLARPGIEYFYIPKPLKFTINGKPFEWKTQFIQGKQIRSLGKIDPEDKIYLDIESPYKDDLITDDEWVDLARPGTEHFFSQQTAVCFTLIVNGREKSWNSRYINYKQAVTLAFGSFDENPNILYTITYSKGPSENPQGSLEKTDSVKVTNKMIFNVTATDKS
ncbi:multiubiquitin domain-containing protein [Cytophagaceae bacterium DM2B3-1]|uniref:Multiubiquitin domain-containing protein n=1 Tax=Xanthocytophaga flava TaxID=3048013 RepID=A0ABT7CV52_9BACT|nr:multiubiquitin domain-containing protein [Xanthocytophaga flavus]MDJ1497653.1 multiubiquitin domain-containing protein [Xanthocytophaga flavus]